MRAHGRLLATTGILSVVLIAAEPARAQAGSQAVAQPPASGGLGDIVVTATRRNEKLQSVGVAVTALNGQELRSRGIVDVHDIAKVAPGVVFDSTTAGDANAQLTIRGISQTDFSPHQESPNSVYVDDVYILNTSSLSYPMFDVANLEVLRGPQGTLFGRASSGGLVSVYSNKPTSDWSGYAEMGYGSYNEMNAEAAVSGPLSDAVRFRISGRVNDSDGWWKNYLPGAKNAEARSFAGIRGQIEADLAPNFTARVEVSYNDMPRTVQGTYDPKPSYVAPSGQVQLVPENLDVYGTGPGNDVLGYRSPYGARKGAFNDIGYFGSRLFSPSLYLNWRPGEVDINSITNYSHFSSSYREDSDGTPIDGAEYSVFGHTRQFSEELRATSKVGRLRWTAGLYFLRYSQDFDQFFSLPAFSGTPFSFAASDPIRQRVTSIAAFGQLEYDLTDKLKLIGGARVTREQKKFASTLLVSEFGGETFSPALVAYDFSKATVGNIADHKETLPSGKLELDYKANSDTLFYASATRGIKAAGYNLNLTGAVDDSNTLFKSEYLYAYEAGMKLSLFENHVHFNTALFYNDYHRFQGYAYVGTVGRVGNYNGHLYGVEAELNAALRGDLRLSLGGNYLNSAFHHVGTQYNGPDQTEQAAQAPHFTANGSISKGFEVGPGKLSLEWDGNYLAKRYVSIDNYFGSKLPGKFEHNAHVSYNLQKSGLEFTFWVNNISNNKKPIAVTDLTATVGDLEYSYDRPRWFGGSIKKSF